jgi:cellulose synthase/poly-beta-1,6-N-acetylglucosamine synthase-like glycosyltransferase
MTPFEVILESYTAIVLIYFVATSVGYAILLAISFHAVRDYVHRSGTIDYRAILQSELSTPISIIAPAYNESATIVQSVHSLLSLHYPTTEVIIINDGSKDDTLNLLINEFALRKSHRAYFPSIPTEEVLGIYRSTKRQWDSLVVIDKINGGKADALNAGINVSRHPLFCAIDADSVLEDDALLKASRPFMDDPLVVAVGGIVRIANNCVVERGRVIEIRLPRKRLPIFQIIEYLRAFLAARMGWSEINGLLIISGAFGLFRKDVVIACGGYNRKTVGEDMELVTRMHHYLLERGLRYRMVFVPDPVCWTEVPETLWTLGRQRNRWQRGLLDTIILHRSMFLIPQYRQIGMLALPFFALFELFGPLVEFSGYLIIPLSALLGFLNVETFFLFFVVAIVYGVFFSVGAVLLEEISFRRYPRPADLIRLLLHALFENFGYRQLTVWWRVKGLWDYFHGRRGWGAMQRTGFAQGRDGT